MSEPATKRAAAGAAATSWSFFCEQDPRWSAALRAEFAATNRPDCARKVHSDSAASQLDGLSPSSAPLLLGLEVTAENLADRLREIDRWRRAPTVCVVGLVREDSFAADDAPSVGDALSEAGARLVIRSPLQIVQLIPLADRHAALVWDRLAALLPPHELIWRRLPWQPAPWALR